MPQLRKVSGEKLLKILCNTENSVNYVVLSTEFSVQRILPRSDKIIRIRCKLGFIAIRQRGSHVVVSKETSAGKIGTVVPMHKELKIGTLKGIFKQAQVSEEEISEFL